MKKQYRIFINVDVLLHVKVLVSVDARTQQLLLSQKEFEKALNIELKRIFLCNLY